MANPTTFQWADPAAGAQFDPQVAELLKLQQGQTPVNADYSEYLRLGLVPQDGMTFRGAQAPTAPAGAKGRYVLTNTGAQSFGGPDSGQQSVANNEWTWIGEPQASPAAAQQPTQQRPQEPTAPANGKTIYNDWDTFQSKARADVEGINRMPFTFADYGGVSTDPSEAMNQFYPAHQQTQGVQKVIGPNGSNIAPQLQQDGLLHLFKPGGGADTSGQVDFPSLVKLLQSGGLLSPDATEAAAQQQALLGLAAPRKLDQSFGGQALLGMGR